MRGGRTLAAVAATLLIASGVGAADREPARPGAEASAGQGAPGVVSENTGVHPSGRTRSQGGPGVDPGNTHIRSGNTRFYSPRGVAPPGETVTRGTADPEAGRPQGAAAGQNPGGR